jgi:hypothetical protein
MFSFLAVALLVNLNTPTPSKIKKEIFYCTAASYSLIAIHPVDVAPEALIFFPRLKC